MIKLYINDNMFIVNKISYVSKISTHKSNLVCSDEYNRFRILCDSQWFVFDDKTEYDIKSVSTKEVSFDDIGIVELRNMIIYCIEE